MPRASSRVLTALSVGVPIVSWLAFGSAAEAQPAYSVRSASECDTCHIEPTDWANPQVQDRLCSLNCTTCHVSPAGGGLRTPSGQFYGQEEVPIFGHRPSDDAAKRDNPTDGGFSLIKGFSGWQPGSTPSSAVADRYGKINPDPSLRFGADLRGMAYFPTTGDDSAAVFPMQVDLYGMARVSRHLMFYTDAGLYSSKATFNLDEEDKIVRPGVIDYLKVEELFVKVDRLPYQMYVRAGRLNPTYGWRIPDHTAFVRRDLGFGETRSWYGVEAGINPNYPYANVALFYQGISAWPGDVNAPGYGASASAGVRELGWQAGGNVHFLRLVGGGHDLSFGPQGAVNLAPLAYLGELDVRLRRDAEGVATRSLYAYHELQYEVRDGVIGKLKFDWQDPDVSVLDDHLNRLTIGADVSPYTGIELEPQFRHTWVGGGVFALGGETYSEEVLLMLHGWI